MGRLVKGKTFYTKSWYGTYHSMMDRCYRDRVFEPKAYECILKYKREYPNVMELPEKTEVQHD